MVEQIRKKLGVLAQMKKPTEKIHNGSICIEIDTGKLYIFDKSSEEWKAI